MKEKYLLIVMFLVSCSFPFTARKVCQTSINNTMGQFEQKMLDKKINFDSIKDLKSFGRVSGRKYYCSGKGKFVAMVYFDKSRSFLPQDSVNYDSIAKFEVTNILVQKKRNGDIIAFD